MLRIGLCGNSLEEYETSERCIEGTIELHLKGRWGLDWVMFPAKAETVTVGDQL